MDGTQTLDLACEQLQQELPDKAARVLPKLRSRDARWIRIPLGVLCLVGAAFWFLPIVGIELLPVGLLLLAEDVPWLRKPAGRFVLFAVRHWRRLKRRFQARGA